MTFAVLTVLGMVAACSLLLRPRRDEGFEVEGLRVGLTKHGRGVFATRKYARDEIIEVCPLVVDHNDSWGEALADYIFGHGSKNSALALGYCSLYNHSDTPNVTYEVDKHTNCMVFKAERDIRSGEQFFVHYGGDWWESRGLTPE